MYDNKLLRKTISPMKHIIYLAQFDGYHSYPVDIHSLQSVKALENINDPFVKELHDSFTSKEKLLLKLVVLLHDAGKGRTQNHHDVGVKLFNMFAQNLDFDTDDLETGKRLIKYHTTMSSMAFKEDIHHDNTVFKFINLMQTKQRINMLYVLTYADINGVGNSVYNSYNSKLLKQLYLNAIELLERDELLSQVQKRIRKENLIIKNEQFLNLSKIQQKKILSIQSNSLFEKQTIQEILENSITAFETKNYQYKIQTEPYLSIQIFRTIPLNLGYLLHKLNFLDVKVMEIYSLFDNVKYFDIHFSDTINQDEYQHIEYIIENNTN